MKLSVGALCLSLTVSINTFAACITTAVETTPTADFTGHNNGTVTHQPTGLMWQVCSQGQAWAAGTGCSTGAATTHTWQAALAIPASLNAGGGYATYTDWRLPNIKELASITELRCSSPSINESVFPDTDSSFYWSSSPVANGSSEAWGVYFVDGNGYDDNRGSDRRVRLVRGGQ
jgi:hypothetical protein